MEFWSNTFAVGEESWIKTSSASENKKTENLHG